MRSESIEARRAVGHHLGAEDERRLGVRDLARVLRDGLRPPSQTIRFGTAERDDQEAGGDGDDALHRSQCRTLGNL